MHNGPQCALLLLVAVFAVSPTGSAAGILEVDDDGGTPYQTIQSAIEAATPGQDQVFVHCGVYRENLVMRDQVSLSGQGARCTIIDGGELGPVVSIIDVGSDTVLEGFTIRNGLSDVGGGIFLEASSPTITRNVIEDNVAIIEGASTGYGGGIFVSGPLASLLPPPGGAAPTITRNVIRYNYAEAWGGGIEIYNDGGSIISNNIIEQNMAVEGGGGIDVFDSTPSILNNTIVRNCVEFEGEVGCLQAGGGIALASSGKMDVANNVLAWNVAADGGGVDVFQSMVDFLNNNAFANQPVDYAGEDPTGSDGNISVDPLFVSAGYEPRSDSPIVDAGTGNVSPTPVVDLLGIARPLDGDVDGDPRHDIGARENQGVTRLRFVGVGDLGWDPSVEPLVRFNLYRGDLQVLLETQLYVQDPAGLAGVHRWCGLASPAVADLEQPDPGEAYFYIAVLRGAVEGSLGFDSTSAERSKAGGNLCP